MKSDNTKQDNNKHIKYRLKETKDTGGQIQYKIEEYKKISFFNPISVLMIMIFFSSIGIISLESKYPYVGAKVMGISILLTTILCLSIYILLYFISGMNKLDWRFLERYDDYYTALKNYNSLCEYDEFYDDSYEIVLKPKENKNSIKNENTRKGK